MIKWKSLLITIITGLLLTSNPASARFYGVDPVGFQAGNTISFNRYGYANNNPFKFTDPNGELPNELSDGSIKDMSIDAHSSDTNEDIETRLTNNPKVATTIFGYARDIKRLSTIESKIPVELGAHLSAVPADMIGLGSLEKQLSDTLAIISKLKGVSINNIPVSMHGARNIPLTWKQK